MMENLYVNKVPVLGEEIFIRMSRVVTIRNRLREKGKVNEIRTYMITT